MNDISNYYLYSYLNRRRLRKLFRCMVSHIDKCPLEKRLKFRKINKISKIIKDLNSLNDLPIKVHKIGIIWLNERWKKIVKENGFQSINNTLIHLDINLANLITNLTEPENNLNNFNNNEFLKYYKNIILPINCQIRKITNKNPKINVCRVRPSLPTLEGKLYGLCVEFEQPDFTIRIFGIIDNDPMKIYRKEIDKTKIINDLQNKYKLSKDIIKPYLNSISLRDYLALEFRQISTKIKQQVEKIEFYKKADLSILSNEYQFLQEFSKIELLNLLLTNNMQKHSQYLINQFRINIKYLDWDSQKNIEYNNSSIFTNKINKEEDAPYEMKISSMNASDKIKEKAFDKLKMTIKSSDGAPKAQKYLDGILKIPFGIIRSEADLQDPTKKLINTFITKFPEFKSLSKLSILKNGCKNKKSKQMAKTFLKKIDMARDKQQQYLIKVGEILEKCVHGHKLVKTQIKRLLAKWISGGQSGIVLGIEGPPGNGKTTLIKQGLAKCLVDQHGNPRPVGFIPLGGSSNASTLVGHGYTYQGSTWGRLVDILMDGQCMNPVFMFDELDKVSKSEHGKDIIGILTHLTDISQNEEFYDKYFEGVPLDLSKALMIFTFNDRNVIDPILLDRMTIIRTEALSIHDKKAISRKHLIPQITAMIDIEPDVIKITDEHIEELITNYTREAGARQLKRLFEDLIQELNLRRLLAPDTEMIIDNELINDVFHYKDKIRKESISEDPVVGQINGMYANVLSMGGIMPIQVSSHSGESKLELTGMQGDVMQESMKCAKTMAFSMLLKNNETFLSKDKLSKMGLHIHCPSASTPKDGPSAGGAICLAIYSFISKKEIRSDIAMTGEIDLRGKITAIGGLKAKLCGAKKAGVTCALIPKENHQQLERLRSESTCPEDLNFKVIEIDNVEEALEYALVKKKASISVI